MFRVDSMKSDDTWDIREAKTGKVVGYIRLMQDSRTHVKKLFVKEAFVDNVKSQKEALEKLKAFYEGLRTRILSNELVVEALKRDMKAVKSEHAYKLIKDDILRIEKNIMELESLNLLSHK